MSGGTWEQPSREGRSYVSRAPLSTEAAIKCIHDPRLCVNVFVMATEHHVCAPALALWVVPAAEWSFGATRVAAELHADAGVPVILLTLAIIKHCEGSWRGINNVFLVGIRVCDERGLYLIRADGWNSSPCGNEADAGLHIYTSLPPILCLSTFFFLSCSLSLS